jgi:hypothetical protein
MFSQETIIHVGQSKELAFAKSSLETHDAHDFSKNYWDLAF